MERARIIADDVVDRYLARRLSAEEEAEFEAYLVANPELADEIDLTNYMRLGLRTLRQRGELESLPPTIGPARNRAFAIAASILVVIVAATFITLWRASLEAPLMALSPAAFANGDRSPTVTASYTLMRSRIGGMDLVLERAHDPAIVQLRVLPKSSDLRGPFRAALSRTDSVSGREETVALVEGVAVGAQGFLTIFVDARRLEPGLYRLALTDMAAPPKAASAGLFLLDVR